MNRVFSCLVVMFFVTCAFAGNPAPGNPNVYPPDANVFGMSYGEWEVAWWQSVLTIGFSTNPLAGNSSDCFVGPTSGPVLFLAGSAGSGPVVHNCTTPAGKAIFVPIINIECSTAEVSTAWDGSTAQKARQCASEWADGIEISTMKATIDNQKVFNLGGYRVQTPYFYFMQPQGDPYLGFDGYPDPLGGWTYGYSVSDGYWLMIKPLSKGLHTIHLQAKFTSGPGAGFGQDLTFNITVQ